MTKKDFKVIAEAIKSTANYYNITDGSSRSAYGTEWRNRLIDNLCKEFKKINPLFNETKFRSACK